MLSTVLILVGMTACVYGANSLPRRHLLAKFLDSLHLSERAQQEWKYWNDKAKRNSNSSPSWNPLYHPQTGETYTPEKRNGGSFTGRPDGPFTSGPFTGGPDGPFTSGPFTGGPDGPFTNGPFTGGPGGSLTGGPDGPFTSGPFTGGPDGPFTSGPFTGGPGGSLTGGPDGPFTSRPFTGGPDGPFTSRPFTGGPDGPFTSRPFNGGPDGPFTNGPFTGGPGGSLTGGPDGPFTSGPFTGGPVTGGPITNRPFTGPPPSVNPSLSPPTGEPATNLPKGDEDGELSQLLRELRQIVEEQYKENAISSYNTDGTKPTYSPKHTKPTSEVPGGTFTGGPITNGPFTGRPSGSFTGGPDGPFTGEPGGSFTGGPDGPFTGGPIAKRPFTGGPGGSFTGGPDGHLTSGSFTGGPDGPFTSGPFTGGPDGPFTGGPGGSFSSGPFTGVPITNRPFTGGPGGSFTGGPGGSFTGGLGGSFTGGPDRPFTSGPFTGGPITGGPFTGVPPPTDEPVANLREETNRRKVAELLGNLSRILERFNSKDNDFTTDSSPTGTPASTKAPGSDSDDDDDRDIRDLVECWMYDVLGDFFRGFPDGPIRNNLTVDGIKVHYILTRAVRQFHLSGGEMDEVLKSMIKGIIGSVILPHNTCPATKFHQVVIWAMKSQMKYHLTNDSRSLKEQFKAILTNSSFDPNKYDQVAGHVVSELQQQLQERAINFLKSELLSDFLDPIEYIVKEMIPMFHAPRNNTQIDVLLHVVEQNNPWLTTCITPNRLMEMHRNLVYRLDEFVKYEEIYEFLDRAEETLEEEFLISTGSEQRPLVKQLINALEAHIRGYVNSSHVYSEALLGDNTGRLTSFLAPIMKPSQQAYFQQIMTSLGPVNTGTSTPGK
ncbi:keratin, type I cytoskeletal 9-like isoform X2 [Mizuhopecten yessoensis]|uniref:keratin, type I cytoskeletal 9-like isoform X2 n=1 Tax=Mizuhopecten yessoensis TaxID=6573 RepID=UPI000B45E86F|nr:keratin, type I cytoskeletal 9-like isoform X2 [Mizuhopecten yessoensis]